MPQDILSQIVADKRIELAELRRSMPLEKLRDLAMSSPASSRSMSASLRNSSSGIIAEFKRRSPSKGWIHEDADPLAIIPSYASSGASALSVLTDLKYFGGRLDFIRSVRPLVDVPILRKDFIIDEYQLLEARAAGADAVLLIAACLPEDLCAELLSEAHALGLEVLLETHSIEELPYARLGADMVGINNRNLGTFHTDVMNSFRLSEALKAEAAGCVLVSESGISDPRTVTDLREKGFRGFLMGENFMKQPDPGKALSDFIGKLC